MGAHRGAAHPGDRSPARRTRQDPLAAAHETSIPSLPGDRARLRSRRRCSQHAGERRAGRPARRARAAGASRARAEPRRHSLRRLRVRPHRRSACSSRRAPTCCTRRRRSRSSTRRPPRSRAWAPPRACRRSCSASGHVEASGEFVGAPLPARRRRPDLRLARVHPTPTTGASARACRRSRAQLVHDGIHRVSGTIEGDESYFDSLRGEPSSGYAPDPYLEGTLSALAFNRGETGSYRGTHAPAEYAAHELALALRADHVRGRREDGRGEHAAAERARSRASPRPRSPSCSRCMLPPSDNFFAETLVKDLGARFGGAGSTAAGARGRAHHDREPPRHPPTRRRRLRALARRPHRARTGGRAAALPERESARGVRSATRSPSRGTPGRSRTACSTAPRRGAAARRRARSRASRTSPATAKRRTGTSSRSRSSTTRSRSKRRASLQDNMAITIARY